MAHSKVQFGGPTGKRRDTNDTESDLSGMRFADSRQLESFTMNTHPSSNKTLGGPVSMPPINRKSSMTALFKVILLGDSLVGKSSILMRLVVIIRNCLIKIARIILSRALADNGLRFCKHFLLSYKFRVSRN
jgi:hypothetical protein